MIFHRCRWACAKLYDAKIFLNFWYTLLWNNQTDEQFELPHKTVRKVENVFSHLCCDFAHHMFYSSVSSKSQAHRNIKNWITMQALNFFLHFQNLTPLMLLPINTTHSIMVLCNSEFVLQMMLIWFWVENQTKRIQLLKFSLVDGKTKNQSFDWIKTNPTLPKAIHQTFWAQMNSVDFGFVLLMAYVTFPLLFFFNIELFIQILILICEKISGHNRWSWRWSCCIPLVA